MASTFSEYSTQFEIKYSQNPIPVIVNPSLQLSSVPWKFAVQAKVAPFPEADADKLYPPLHYLQELNLRSV